MNIATDEQGKAQQVVVLQARGMGLDEAAQASCSPKTSETTCRANK